MILFDVITLILLDASQALNILSCIKGYFILNFKIPC